MQESNARFAGIRKSMETSLREVGVKDQARLNSLLDAMEAEMETEGFDTDENIGLIATEEINDELQIFVSKKDEGQREFLARAKGCEPDDISEEFVSALFGVSLLGLDSILSMVIGSQVAETTFDEERRERLSDLALDLSQEVLPKFDTDGWLIVETEDEGRNVFFNFLRDRCHWMIRAKTPLQTIHEDDVRFHQILTAILQENTRNGPVKLSLGEAKGIDKGWHQIFAEINDVGNHCRNDPQVIMDLFDTASERCRKIVNPETDEPGAEVTAAAEG